MVSSKNSYISLNKYYLKIVQKQLKFTTIQQRFLMCFLSRGDLCVFVLKITNKKTFHLIDVVRRLPAAIVVSKVCNVGFISSVAIPTILNISYTCCQLSIKEESMSNLMISYYISQYIPTTHVLEIVTKLWKILTVFKQFLNDI